MKHYKLNGKVHALKDDQLHLVQDEMIEMTDNEVNRHLRPFDFMTDEEKIEYKRSQYPKLTRYQFMRGMLEYGYKSSDIETQIMLIEDEYTRELTMIGFKDATNFVRTDPSIDVMRDILGKTDLEIDEFWELCVTF